MKATAMIKKNSKALKVYEKQLEAKYTQRKLDEIKLRARTLTELNIKVYEDSEILYESIKTSALGSDGVAPDWRAGNALFDRAYGKAKESVDVSGNGQPIIFMPLALIKKFSLENIEPLHVDSVVVNSDSHDDSK